MAILNAVRAKIVRKLIDWALDLALVLVRSLVKFLEQEQSKE